MIFAAIDSSSIQVHYLRLSYRTQKDRYLPVDGTMIPIGNFSAVKNTPFDFTNQEYSEVGDRIEAANGYDVCFELKKTVSIFFGLLTNTTK